MPLAIAELARQGFKDLAGHYHADSRLSSHACEEIYVDWALRGLAGEAAEAFYVAEMGGAGRGLRDVHPEWRLRVTFQLSTVASWARGKGLYTACMRRGMAWRCRAGVANEMIGINGARQHPRAAQPDQGGTATGGRYIDLSRMGAIGSSCRARGRLALLASPGLSLPTMTDNSTDTEAQGTQLSIRASAQQRENRETMKRLFEETPLPLEDLLVNLPLYMRSSTVAKLLWVNELYELIVRDTWRDHWSSASWWGREPTLFESLRAVHEPYNYNRRVVGVRHLCRLP